MIRLVTLLSFLVVLQPFTFAQGKNCFEIRGIEFFVPANVGRLPTDRALDEVISSESKPADFLFLIPSIVEQLVVYDPICGNAKLDERFRLLLKTYAHIRKVRTLLSDNLSTNQKLEIVRKDFRYLVNNDRLYRKLIYTMDDGPLSGHIRREKLGKPKESREVATGFGKVILSNYPNRVVVTAKNTKGKELWSRVLTGSVPRRYLRAASTDKPVLVESEVALSISVFVDGERLTLYTRPDGRFMYYNYSW